MARSLQVLIPLSIVQIALLMHQLGTHSLWLDEVMSINVALRPLGSMFEFFRLTPEQHPLYYLLLKPWLSLGTSEVVLRSFSAVFTLGSLWAVYFLARDLLGEKVAWVSAALLSVSPYFLYYGQEGRMYSLLGFLAIVNSHLFVLWTQHTTRRRLLPYIATAILGLYTHFFFLFLLAAHSGFLLLRDRRISRDVLKCVWGQFIVGVAFLPWAWVLFSNLPSGQPWKGLEHVVFGVPYTFMRFALGFSEVIANQGWKNDFGTLLSASWPMLVAGTVVFGTLGLAGLAALRRTGAAGLFVACGLILPMAISVLASLIVILSGDRYFIVSYPFFVMLLASGIVHLWQSAGLQFKLGLVSSAALSVLTCSILVGYYSNPQFGKTQWREAAQFVESNSLPQDPIYFHSDYVIAPFDYYFAGPQARRPLSQAGSSELGQLDRFWVVTAHAGSSALPAQALPASHEVTLTRNFPFESGIDIALISKR